VAKTWVLRTETKGTGAHVVPLESAKTGVSSTEPVFVPRKPAKPAPPPTPARRAPRQFRVVDVMTRQSLLENGNAREAVEALRTVRSNMDVNVYVWEDERDRWRLLTLGEQATLFELARRGRASPDATAT
jgi:hypothetical protein